MTGRLALSQLVKADNLIPVRAGGTKSHLVVRKTGGFRPVWQPPFLPFAAFSFFRFPSFLFSSRWSGKGEVSCRTCPGAVSWTLLGCMETFLSCSYSFSRKRSFKVILGAPFLSRFNLQPSVDKFCQLWIVGTTMTTGAGKTHVQLDEYHLQFGRKWVGEWRFAYVL